MKNDILDFENLALQSYELETTEITQTHRIDLRTKRPDLFIEHRNTDWSRLSWKDLPKRRVAQRTMWHEAAPKNPQTRVPTYAQWKRHNRNFHALFTADPLREQKASRRHFLRCLQSLKIDEANEHLKRLIRLKLWNDLHHKDDAIWDPRGKRAIFSGLEAPRPNVLVLGAGDGYDAMTLLSMYPQGHGVLVDYDDFCRSHRFGVFPEDYPFLSRDPKTRYWNVYNKEDLNLDFETSNIRNLKYGREFDIVLSAGLIEHFPDKYKPLVFHIHRKFLKPGGYIIMLSSRNQRRIRTLYHLIGDFLNDVYREFMDARHLGLYAYDNGLKVLRCGYIKTYNFIVAKER